MSKAEAMREQRMTAQLIESVRTMMKGVHSLTHFAGDGNEFTMTRQNSGAIQVNLRLREGR